MLQVYACLKELGFYSLFSRFKPAYASYLLSTVRNSVQYLIGNAIRDQVSGLCILYMKFTGNLMLNDRFTNNLNFINC